jgi:hypothetical protein
VPRAAGSAFPWRTWGVAILAGFVALGVGSGLFIDPVRYYRHLMFLAGRVEAVPGEATISTALPMTPSGHIEALTWQVTGSSAILTAAGLALAIGGVLWFVPRSRQARLLLLPALTYSIVVFFLLRAEQIRYLLPLAFVLALFAGAAVDAGLRAPARVYAAAVSVLFALTVSIGALRLVDLTYAMVRDSRYEAARWLETRLVNGDRVEYFGSSQKLPRLPAGVTLQRATAYRGLFSRHDTSSARADSIVREWATRRPAMVIVIPDHTSPWPDAPFDASMPPSLFRALESGELPYRRVARFETAPLLPWIRRRPLEYPMVNPPVHIYAPDASVSR